MLGHLKRLCRRVLPASWYRILLQPPLTVACLLNNQSARWRRAHESPWVYARPGFDPAREAAYALTEFEEYLRDSKLSASDFAGKTLLELGPGNNLGVALLFLNAGARRVICADRFSSLLHPDAQLAIYRALETASGAKLLDRFVRMGDGGILRLDGVDYLANVAGERLGDHLPAESVDIVISRAVLEHVYDLPAVITALDHVLRPGGRMIHEIDFRDHGIYSAHGLHPLTFLTLPEGLWRLMSDRIGAPNRKLSGFFRNELDRLGYTGERQCILTVGRNEVRTPAPFPRSAGDLDAESLRLVREIRPRLAAPFRDLDDVELAVSGIFLSIRKPDRTLPGEPGA